jgi:anti-sigma regulatory factor (Ser/Thr protein kinase)
MRASLRHNAFVYASDEDFAREAAPFLADGLAEGASTVAVTTRRNLALLEDALGDAAEQVAFVDRDRWYVRPMDTIAAYHATLRDLVAGGATAVRVVGEVQFGPTRHEWDQWTSYESIVNYTLAEYPAWIVCPYDERELPDDVVAGALRTHPEQMNGGGTPCSHFEDPAGFLGGLARDYESQAGLRELPVDGDRMAIRERLAAALAAAGAPAPKSLDLLVAADAVAANAFEHGGGPTALRAGLVADGFAVEIADAGPGLDDPLAGYLPPSPEVGRGAGLWVARRLTSRLELLSSGAGLTVRLWL